MLQEKPTHARSSHPLPAPAGTRSGTTSFDPAYEANGLTPSPFPFKTILRRERGGIWVFFADQCSS